MKKLLFLLVIVSAQAAAEQWLGIEGFDYYYDKDSRKRSGDIATISVKHVSALNLSSNAIWPVTVDCKRSLFISNGKAEPINPDTLGSELFKLACKRSWEVWK